MRRGIQAATANVIVQIANYDDVKVTLVGDVATAYVTIRELQAEIALARDNVKTQSDSLKQTELRFKDGVTTELDVQEATVLLNNTKAEIPALQADLAKAENALAVLLGMVAGEVHARRHPVGRHSQSAGKDRRRNPGRSAAAAAGHPGGGDARRSAVRADRNRQGGPLSAVRPHRPDRLQGIRFFDDCSPVPVSPG